MGIARWKRIGKFAYHLRVGAKAIGRITLRDGMYEARYGQTKPRPFVTLYGAKSYIERISEGRGITISNRGK